MLYTNKFDIDIIKQEGRFNPSYFRFLDKRDNLMDASSTNFERLGDKSVSKQITDGEHQAISLYQKGESNADIRYLYVHNIKDGIIDLTDSLYISQKDHMRLSRSKLNKYDVLLTIVGSIGKSAMVYDYLDEANIPRNIAKIVINPEKIYPGFLVAFFLSQFGMEQSYYSSGGNLQGLLSLTKLRSMMVPIPDDKIQIKMNKIYLAALERERKSLELIETARSHFYKSINIDFNEFREEKFFQGNISELKKSDIWSPYYRYPTYLNIENAIRSKWNVKKIGDIFDISRGTEVGSDNYYDFTSRKENYIPFIRTSDFVNYEIDSNPDFYIPQEIYEELNQDLKEGDILFTNDGNIGNVAILTKTDKGIIQSHIRRLRKKSGEPLDPYYVFIPLIIEEIGGYQSKRFTVVQSTIPTISSRLRDIEIPILEEGDMLYMANLVRRAFTLKNQKKKLLNTLKTQMNEFLDYNI